MKKNEIKLIVTISVALAATIALIYLWVLNVPIDKTNVLKGMSFGLSITTAFWIFYFYWGWRVRPFSYIFYRPNLNGTWSGKLYSDWKDDKGNTIPAKEFHIVIRQSFHRIHFTTFTDGFVGTSYAETFRLDKDEGLKNVAYLFIKDTSQTSSSSIHEGATELRLIESNPRLLEGKYFSSQKTNGKIEVSFIAENHVDSFQDASGLKGNG